MIGERQPERGAAFCMEGWHECVICGIISGKEKLYGDIYEFVKKIKETINNSFMERRMW